MGKFTGPSVQPGGVTPELPTTQLEERTPQSEASIFSELPEGGEAAVDTQSTVDPTQGAPVAQEQVSEQQLSDEQRAIERVPSIGERVNIKGSLSEAALDKDTPLAGVISRGGNVNSILNYSPDETSLLSSLPTAKQELHKQGYTSAAFSALDSEGYANTPALKGGESTKISASGVLRDPRVLGATDVNGNINPEFGVVFRICNGKLFTPS